MTTDITKNLAIEQIVLGTILSSEDRYWDVSDILNMDLFASEDHQKIFIVINELANEARAIRTHIVAGRIGSLSEGKDPEAYLSMLLHIASREEHIPLRDYAFELRAASTRRRVIALAEGMIKSANNPKADPDQVVDRAAERIADISREAKIEHESTVSSTIRQIFDTAGSSDSKGIAIEPCLTGLEEMFGFYPPGSLILWGGGPGSGKTAMAMQQLLFTSTAHPCSLFELEMENTSLVARSIAGDTGIRARDIMRGLDESQLEALLEAQRKFSNRQLRIVSPSKMDINQIRSRAYAHKRKFGLRMMAVDHLKLIERNSKNRMDPVERAYENARDLKSLAKDLGCVVIALCQFTKAARQKETPEPEMEDFYGGSLEEHADLMLANFNRHQWLLKNPPRTSQGKAMEDHQAKVRIHEGRIEVHKLKDRFGSPRDMKRFYWDGKNTRYQDITGSQSTMNFADMPDLDT